MSRDAKTAIALSGVLLAGGLLPGCDDSSEQAAQATTPQRTTPRPPPPPAEVNFDALLQTEGADPRVQIGASVSTEDESLARAAIALASAVAGGDADAMRSALTEEAAAVVDSLTATGEWADATAGVEAVRITALSGTSLTLAVQDPGGAYPLLWTVVRGDDGVIRFTGEPAPDVELSRASQFDDGIPEPEQAISASFTPSLRYPSLADIQAAAGDPATAQLLTAYQQAHNPWMASLGDEAFYLNFTIGVEWAQNTVGLDLTSGPGKQAVAQQYAMTPDAIDSKLENGQAAWGAGDRCTPAEMLGTIESYTLLPAFPQPERAVVAMIGDITGLSGSEIRGMADRARQEGASVFASIVPPEPEADEPDAEEEDDGVIEKSSPAGPIRIPTKRPDEG